MQALLHASSVVCHGIVAGPRRVRCLVVGHDDRLTREVGRLALQCDECGRRTRGWTIGPAGPRFMTGLPPAWGSAVGTPRTRAATERRPLRLITPRRAP